MANMIIEEVVLNYLREELDVPVAMQEPDNESRYVLIEKTGSSRENHINSATLAIKSHADSLYEAAILNELVKLAMDNIVSLNEISSSKLNTDYNFTDTTKKKYRYQAVYHLVY